MLKFQLLTWLINHCSSNCQPSGSHLPSPFTRGTLPHSPQIFAIPLVGRLHSTWRPVFMCSAWSTCPRSSYFSSLSSPHPALCALYSILHSTFWCKWMYHLSPHWNGSTPCAVESFHINLYRGHLETSWCSRADAHQMFEEWWMKALFKLGQAAWVSSSSD